MTQGRRRDRLGGQVRAGHRNRSGAVNGDRRDDHGGVLAQPGVGQRHVVEQRGAGRRARRCHPGHRGGSARTGQRHRVPLPNAKGRNGFRMQTHHSTPGVERRRVQACGQPQVAQRRIRLDLRLRHLTHPVCVGRAASSTGGVVGLPPVGAPCAPRAVVVVCRPTPPDARPGNAWCGSRTGCG